MPKDGKQTFVILGGTGAVGSALVRHLTEIDANVVVGVRDTIKSAALSEETSCDVHPAQADNPNAMEACVKAARKRMRKHVWCRQLHRFGFC